MNPLEELETFLTTKLPVDGLLQTGADVSVLSMDENPKTQKTILPGEQISNIDTPIQEQWAFHQLYSESQVVGRINMWQVGFDPYNVEIVTLHGMVDGSIQEDRLQVEAKVNRSNQEQGLLQARKKYIDKYRSGYRPAGEPMPDWKPQLGAKYKAPGSVHATTGKPQKTNIKEFPVAVQSKIDGFRGITETTAMGTEIVSRTKIPFSWFDNIIEELNIFFAYLPPNTKFDGELYTQDLSFEQLQSAINTGRKKKDKKNPNVDLVDFYIFDIIEPRRLVLEDRLNLLYGAYKQYILDGHRNVRFHIVNTDMAFSHEEIKLYHDQYVRMGYEGLMIRKFAGLAGPRTTKRIAESQYKGGRNNNLLKVKSWNDEEGTVISVKEGTGRETGLAIFRVVDDAGIEFDVRPRGAYPKRRRWFLNKSELIGQRYTYRYFEKTADGIPRFPTGIAFRLIA